MDLKDFRLGNFVQTEHGLSKIVISDQISTRIVIKDGSEFEVNDVTRVYLSESQLKNVPGFEKTGVNSFVLNGMPGRLSFNYTSMSFEWIVQGQKIRDIDYLDELQNLYRYCTGSELF